MRNSKAVVFIALGFLLLLAACSEAPQKAVKKQPEKPPEPIDGQRAFFQMYVSARAWAGDVQGLRLQSIPLKEVKRQGGKYGAWQATFVSPSKRRQISFTWSAVESYGNLHKGVFRGQEEGFSGTLDQPWPISAFKVSSEKALEVALSKSKSYVKKHPNKPITFLLAQTRRYTGLTWRVIWGENVSTSDYSIFVDASTGKFLERVH